MELRDPKGLAPLLRLRRLCDGSRQFSQPMELVKPVLASLLASACVRLAER
jgi:hypothetical protein